MSRVIGVIVLANIFGLTFAWFESCNQSYNLQLGDSRKIVSPNYPNGFTPGSSCKYKITAPSGTKIQLQCQVKMASSLSCKNEAFYIASDGNNELTNSEYFCGSGSIQRSSVYSELAIAYTSSSTNSTGSYFYCTVSVQTAFCDCGWSISTRIVGGGNALVNEYTSAVGLVSVVSSSIFCGGTILSPKIVVTAAQCLNAYNYTAVMVLVGESDITIGTESPYTKIYGVKRFIKHPQYSQKTNINDIGLIETTAEILYSRGVGPACFPFSYMGQTFTNVKVEVAGWGSTAFGGSTSNILKKASLTVISNSQCMNSYSNLSPSQMCTYTPGNDSCQMDTGGPLYLRKNRLYLVGIVSYGNGCAGKSPSVNTRITSYLPWIDSYVDAVLCMK